MSAASSAPDNAVRESGFSVVRRGLAQTPEIRDGLGLTMLLALIGTLGSVAVPIIVKYTIDSGLGSGRAPSLDDIGPWLLAAIVTVIATAAVFYVMRVRLFIASERGLATMRVRAFRHVHSLSMLTQNRQRRGVLVARVTSDVDQVSMFLQYTGMMLVLSFVQIIVATAVMAFYSWQLTIVVIAAFVPLFVSLRWFAGRLSRAYDVVRRTVGDMVAVIAEPVVGASVVKAHAIEHRTQQRVDTAISANLTANVRAQRLVAITFSAAGLAGGLAIAGAVGVGVWLGVAGTLSVGTVIAFVFLVGLVVGPTQNATQVITDAQNAIASWRRVLDLLDTPADVVDPGEQGRVLPHGILEARFESVRFAYPGGPDVLQDLDVQIRAGQRIAVVGETGSGKTTFAKLLTRLMDPSDGVVSIGGVDLRQVSFSALRGAVLMVPQEGFLFDATLRDNIAYGVDELSDDDVYTALDRLDLRDWFESLPAGLATQVGQRGESLSAGERQLVALVRAAVADPRLLVLDEATSAVDPSTEMRATRALERLLQGRTSVTIAHRLTTAENADRVLVFDAGRLVEDGRHQELVGRDGVYARLHASWVAQSTLGARQG